MRIALVSGASSGLGREFARQLDQRRERDRLDELWLLARREDRLRELAQELTTPCRVFPLDLQTTEARGVVAAALKEAGAELVWLINAAGMGRIGRGDRLAPSDNRALLRLNCEALTELSLLASPFLHSGSQVIEVASTAAFLPQPGFAVYAASKAYVLSFSRALAREWRGRGIHVLACCPNPMDTEFFTSAGKQKDSNVEKIKQLGLESVEKVARCAIRRCLKGNDLSVSSPLARLLLVLSRILPHPLILWMEGKLGFWEG